MVRLRHHAARDRRDQHTRRPPHLVLRPAVHGQHLRLHLMDPPEHLAQAAADVVQRDDDGEHGHDADRQDVLHAGANA